MERAAQPWPPGPLTAARLARAQDEDMKPTNKPTVSDWARLFPPAKDSGSRVTASDLERVFGGSTIKKKKLVRANSKDCE